MTLSDNNDIERVVSPERMPPGIETLPPRRGGLAAVLDKLLVVLMVAILLTLSLPVVLMLFRQQAPSPAIVPTPQPIHHERVRPHSQENVVFVTMLDREYCA